MDQASSACGIHSHTTTLLKPSSKEFNKSNKDGIIKNPTRKPVFSSSYVGQRVAIKEANFCHYFQHVLKVHGILLNELADDIIMVVRKDLG